jgi:hypothetical protein
VLFDQKIAQVSTIIKMITNKDYYTAIIIVKEWLDTEVAYNFIKRLNKPLVETRIVHKDDNWWRVSFEPLISSTNTCYQKIKNQKIKNQKSKNQKSKNQKAKS